MKKLLTQWSCKLLVGVSMLFSSGGYAQCDSLVDQTDYYKFQDGSYGFNYDHKNACLTLADNSVITCEPTSTAYPDVHVTRMSWRGNKAWEYNYDLGGNDVPQSIINTSDGGYVIAGITEAGGGPFHPYRDIFLMKINSTGTLLWAYNYQIGILNYDWGSATVAELTDGNLIVVGHGDMVNQFSTLYFMKTSSNGSTYTHKRYYMPSRRYQSLEDVVATPNGGFIAVGSSGHNWDYNGVLAIAFDNTFTAPTWAKHYILYTPGGSLPSITSPLPANRSNIMAKAIATISNGNYAITGFHQNANQYGAGATYIQGLIMEIDIDGDRIDTGQELWSFGSQYTILNDITECVGQPTKWVATGTVDINTSAPRNVAHFFYWGGTSRGNVYWGYGTSNRAFNIFHKKVGATGIFDTYVTGYTNEPGVEKPYFLKLETYYPPCVDVTSGIPEEITERIWDTIPLVMPDPTEACCAPISLLPQRADDCHAPLEQCTDLCDYIKIDADMTGRKVTVNMTFKSTLLFVDSLDFGDGYSTTFGYPGTYDGLLVSRSHTYSSPGIYAIWLYVDIYDPSAIILKKSCAIPYYIYVPLSGKEEPEVHTTKEITMSEVAYNPMTNSVYKVDDAPGLQKLLIEHERITARELVAKELDVKLYPNPGTDYTELELNMQKAGTVSITMYDITGRLVNVVRGNAQLEAGKNTIKADVSGLPKGTYFFRIETTEGNTARSFIKQ